MDGSPRATSQVSGSDEYASWDAAYVLGSLTSTARGEYESHLRGCPSCRKSVDELSGVPPILGRLTPEEFAAIDDAAEPPPLHPRVWSSLVTTLSRRRRNARLVTWGVSVAAAAAVVIGVLLGVQLYWGATTSVPAPSDASTVTMTRVAATELTATVAVRSYGWGTQFDMNCLYPEEPKTAAPDADESVDRLAMVVVARDGSHDQLATWMAVKGVHATPSASTSRPIDQIAAVEIVTADTGDVLLQRNL